MSLKIRLQDEMKVAMKAKDRQRLGVIRLMIAAIKQREIDERVELNDDAIIVILDKMQKQRRDSFEQFQNAGRDDLAQQETYEMTIIDEYLPAKLAEQELNALIDNAISESGANAPRDMGKVMGILKPLIAGRADMKVVSEQVKKRLM